MKYVMFIEIKEPIEENMKKWPLIESERRKKGDAFEPIAQYRFLSKYKGFQIVDTDESKIVKWMQDYAAVINYEIHPVLTRSEWEAAAK